MLAKTHTEKRRTDDRGLFSGSEGCGRIWKEGSFIQDAVTKAEKEGEKEEEEVTFLRTMHVFVSKCTCISFVCVSGARAAFEKQLTNCRNCLLVDRSNNGPLRLMPYFHATTALSR